MHSLETGIILAITMFFFYSLLLFTFRREVNISNEISEKTKIEESKYSEGGERTYVPEMINNAIVVIDGTSKNIGF